MAEPEPTPIDAAALFEDYLRRRDSGDALALDELCRAHPALASALRALVAAHALVEGCLPGALAEPAVTDPADARTRAEGRSRPGPVAAGPEAPADLIRKLQDRGPRDVRYERRGEVGRGGMGAVLRVFDDELRRTLAMKVVLDRGDAAGERRTTGPDAQTLARFLEEAQITSQLDHPGVVPVHEIGVGSDGRVYFTMRLVEGASLRTVFDHVREGRDGWSQVRALGVLQSGELGVGPRMG